MTDVSVVIPTYRRPDSLRRALASLERQTYPIREVLVVDASDEPENIAALAANFPRLTIRYVRSTPSVCKQRNIGIRQAQSPYIFLCDDDIEAPPDYLGQVMRFLHDHPNVGAASGLVMQWENPGQWDYQYPVRTFRRLIWLFLCQLTVWGDLEHIPITGLNRLPLQWIKRYFAQRGNTLTLAGWPLVTQWTSIETPTTIYGLGAGVVRRDWLLNSPFDEILDPSGIGENYGVAIGFPATQGIHILPTAIVYHHRSSENRLPSEVAYYRRILALHYFMRRSPRFWSLHRVFLVGSLLGQWATQIYQGKKERARASRKAIWLIVANQNPYLTALRQGRSGPISPEL